MTFAVHKFVAGQDEPLCGGREKHSYSASVYWKDVDCKDCWKEKAGRIKTVRKACTKCGVVKLAREFYRHSGYLKSACIPCLRERNRVQARENMRKLREKRKAARE